MSFIRLMSDNENPPDFTSLAVIRESPCNLGVKQVISSLGAVAQNTYPNKRFGLQYNNCKRKVSSKTISKEIKQWN